MGIVGWIVTGLIVGAIARLLVPGPHRLGCIGTSVLGILGSVVGGTIINSLLGNDFQLRTTNWLGAVFGAVVLLVVGRVIGGNRSPANQ